MSPQQTPKANGSFTNSSRASKVIHPSEWSKAVKATVAGLTTIGGIIAMFMTVESWTDEKIQTAVSASEKRQIEEAAKRSAIHDISHDKMIQGERITTAEANIRIAQIELSLLEAEIDGRRADGLQPTTRHELALQRLTQSIRFWQEQLQDAQDNLTRVARQQN